MWMTATTVAIDFSSPLSELSRARREMLERARRMGTDALKPSFKALFDRWPSVSAVRWEQYTDFFNDGDECSFHVHDITWQKTGSGDFHSLPYRLAKIPLSAEDKDYWSAHYLYLIQIDDWWELIDDLAGLNAVLQDGDDDTMKAIFGDHLEITVHRDLHFDIKPNMHHD